jgi:cell division transport system permease protein
MKFRIWIYFFKTAIVNIINNRLVHIISIGTITISMLLFGSFMLLSVNLNNWIKEWGKSISMSVYLEDGIDENTKNKIESELLNLEGAEIKGFISKEKAMIHLKNSLGNQAGLLAGLSDNPLPGSFEIVFRDVSSEKIDPKEIKKNLEQLKGVDEVQYSEQWIERFQGVMYVMRVTGLIIGGLLCIAVLFITTNTIKLTIYSRREEIEIYKLVGATDWFVKIPYLIEGTLQGIIGGIIAFLILFIFFSIFTINTVRLFGLPVMDFVFLSQEISVSIILLSLFLGFIGGLIAIGRFFKT